MTTPVLDDAVAFAVFAGAAVISGSVLRIRRDVTGPPLSRFADGVWTVGLVAMGVSLLFAWLTDVPERWFLWPLALAEVGCLVLVLWDTARQ